MLRFAVALCGAAVLAIAAILLIALTATPRPRSHMQVLESNTRTYQVGKKLNSLTVFDLKRGERIKVLLLPSNRTQVFEGPPTDIPPSVGASRSLE
jgi:hypothetical protein